MEAIQEFFVNIFNDNVWLAILLFAMLPITEARIAIPFGLSASFWGAKTLTPIQAFLCGSIGSFIPSLIIIPLLVPILKYLKKTRLFSPLAEKLERLANKKSQKISETKNSAKRYILLSLFVAVPLPLTGVWTGSLIASILNMSVPYSLIAILVGNLIAGGIITIISVLFDGKSNIFMLILLSIILAYVLFWVVKSLIKYIKNKQTQKWTM